MILEFSVLALAQIQIDKLVANTTVGVAIQAGDTTAGSNVISIDDTNEGISTGMSLLTTLMEPVIFLQIQRLLKLLMVLTSE